ncbi:MAG TPA: EAL domain-containing protein [Chthonomonadales bacterium]|nr:EAL domain-containing protein [Chthonomonadales bacterium]
MFASTAHAVSFTTPSPHDQPLLLVPLDADAEAAITKALHSNGFRIQRHGFIMCVENGKSKIAALRRALEECVPAYLLAHVKGVFTEAPLDSPEPLMEAFLHAEALPTLFEQAEVAWVRNALNEGWLFSVFQPIIEATSGEVFAYEALIRARPPGSEEIIGAAQLLYACNQLHLQHQLDRKARECALRTAATLPFSHVRYFINLLPNAVYDPNIFLHSTLATAQEVGLPLHRIVFEIIEAEHLSNRECLRTLASALRNQGASIALSDIMGGFTSLQYLGELSPDYIKLDRDLVAATVSNPSARYTLDSISQLAHKLNICVVAEGIETIAEMHVCTNAGVDYLQGYLFARPANPPHPIPTGLFSHSEHTA